MKNVDILEDVLSSSSPVEELNSIDSEAFKKRYFNKRQPVVVRGAAKEWEALKKWDWDFFLNLKKDEDIFLLSGKYVQEENIYKKETFKTFIQKLKDSELNNKKTEDHLPALDIFNFFPYLKDYTDFSVFTKHTTKENDELAWLGPAGTISGFHSDTANNMFAQIKGEKMFIIASPKFNKKMYKSKKYMNGGVASEIDINNVDIEKFPKFKDVQFKSVILEPGDILFVPKNWWHYVKSLETSISISNFGYTKSEVYSVKFRERVIDYLHRKGYYKAKKCWCCE